VVGDVAASELGPVLDTAFGTLAAAPAGAETPETTIAASGTTVLRKQVPQSAVMFGLSGPKRDDPDWYAAYVMNYVLGGGGFKSRLIDEVREKRGLAYSVYSYLQPLQHAGIWLGGVGTQNARVAESLTVIRSELRRMAEHGASDQELAEAKTFLNGSFPMSLDSNSRIAGLLVQLQRDKLGPEHLDKRAQLIDAVTAEDVRRVARKLLDPDRLLTVVVGDPEGLGG
jgi:zinc protease